MTIEITKNKNSISTSYGLTGVLSIVVDTTVTIYLNKAHSKVGYFPHNVADGAGLGLFCISIKLNTL